MKWAILLCALYIFSGCGNSDRIPSGIIQKDSMQHILWDLIQADQYAKQFLLKDSSKKNIRVETIKLYQEVLQIHHITKDQFKKSYQFYLTRPDLTKNIFDSLAASGNRRRKEIYKPKPILKKVPN
jgi:hypothetical protein